MKRPLALLIAAVVGLVGSGCSGSTLHDAATLRYSVKGSARTLHVSRDQLLSEVRNIVSNKPFATFLKAQKFTVDATDLTADSKVTAIWLSQLIQAQAIDALFTSRHLHVTKAIQVQAAKDVVQIFPTPSIFPAFSAKFRASLTDRQARTEALLLSYADTSDAAGEAYFKAHESQFGCASGKEVSHILLKTRAAAQGILDQLTAGASFTELAKTKSTDPSGAKGGALGCLAAREFVAAFQNAADAAPLDKPVGPVKTQFGYHVILVTKATTSYAEVRAQVLQALRQQGTQKASTEINALIKSFKVHLDPRFGTWGPTTDAQGQTIYHVTAPTTPTVNDSREGTTTTEPGPVPSNGSP
jgi:parvulin-like peptidyl-prolyl isomerase